MNHQLVKQKPFIERLNGIRGSLEKKTKTLRAVIYARVSSEESAKKKFSIPEIQISESKDLVEEYKWRYVNSYIDEAYDGNSFSKRPALQKMLNENIDTYDVIVIYSFDRLVRDDPYIEAEIYKILDRYKKQVTSVLQRVEIVNPDEYDPKSLNVATQRRFRSMQVAYDSLTRRQRFMISRKKTVKKGKHIVVAPCGYKIIREVDPEDPRKNIRFRAPNKKETPILKRIFKERVLEGKSYRKIALSLNENGIKTRNGKEWSGSRIRQVLINPFPCGYIVWNKTQDRKYGDGRVIKRIPESEWKFIPVNRKLEKYYKSLISKEMYLKAQEIRKKNSQIGGRATGSSNILAGLVKCPKCRASMVETSLYKIKKPPYKRGYYVCSRYINKGLCSKKKYPSWSIKAKALKKVKAFLNNPRGFSEYLKKKENRNETLEKEREVKRYKRKLERAQKRIESLNLKYLDNKIKEEYYFDLHIKLEKGVKQLRETILNLKEEIQGFYQEKEERKSLKALSKEIKDRFESLEPQQMKLILRVLINKVTPDKENIQGKGVKGDPRKVGAIISWKNPAIMEQGCSFLKQL